MTLSLVRAINEFTDPESELQLSRLDSLLHSLSREGINRSEIRALFGVLERFPAHDGFGVFWTMVHCLEASSGYEEELVSSVLRQPVEFNLIMLNRLLNAGIREINGKDLTALLLSVKDHPRASSETRDFADRLIEKSRN